MTGGAAHVLTDGEGGDFIAEEAEFGLNSAPAQVGFSAEPRARDRPVQDHQLMEQSNVLERNGGGAARRAPRKVQRPRTRIIAVPNGEG